MKSTEPDPKTPRENAPDLQTQLESLFHEVWRCEAEWRFEQRLQQALAASKPRNAS